MVNFHVQTQTLEVRLESQELDGFCYYGLQIDKLVHVKNYLVLLKLSEVQNIIHEE